MTSQFSLSHLLFHSAYCIYFVNFFLVTETKLLIVENKCSVDESTVKLFDKEKDSSTCAEKNGDKDLEMNLRDIKKTTVK